MPFALVTGASGGIGLHLAKELAARNYDLLLVARSEDLLRQRQADIIQTNGVAVHYLVCDLSESKATENVMEWCLPYDVEVLVNNAGFGRWGKVESLPSSELRNMIQLNQVTLTELCHAFIQQFKKRKSPSYILNVASTAAYQAVPMLAVYAATKSFVVSFTRALRWEVKGSMPAIHISCLSPGATDTGFASRAHMSESLKKKAEKFNMEASVVAHHGIQGLFSGKAEIIPGFINWLSVKLVAITPKSITEKIAFGLYENDNE